MLDFDRLAAFVVDSDVGFIEKQLNQVKSGQLQLLKNNFGQNLLFCAVGADRVKVVELLVRKKLSLDDVDGDDRTLLHWAVKFSSFNCIKYLLHQLSSSQLRTRIFSKDKFGVTPLHLAAEHKRARLLKILLEYFKNESVNFDEARDNSNRSPLHYAAASGSLECCEELLQDDHFAVDLKDKMIQIPLMYAVGCKFANHVVRLLAHKKPVTISWRNKLGLTSLHLAVLANNLEALGILLTEFEDVSPTLFDEKRRTPLHYAAAMGRVEAAKLLIDHGARNETCDEFGASPAHYAAKRCVKTLEVIMAGTNLGDPKDSKDRTCLMWAVLAENEPVVLWMLSNQSLEINRHAKDKYHCTALHLAAQVGSLPIAKLLIKQGWSLNDCDQNDATPSHLAAGGGHTELIRHFQTALANTDERDGAGRTPLFYACAGGQASTVRIMVNDLNFAINVVDRNGQTPLHYAAISGIAACVKVLLERAEVDVNTVDENGRTALHVACMRGKKEVVQLLLEAGSDPNLTSIQTESPISIATKHGHKQIVELLVLYGARESI